MPFEKRLIAAVIDFYIVIFIIIFSVLLIGIELDSWLLIAVGVVLLCLKDVSGRSVGKKLLKLGLLDVDSERTPSLIKRVLRNISMVIWPVEVFLLLSKRRRIGDTLCHTRVVDFIGAPTDF